MITDEMVEAAIEAFEDYIGIDCMTPHVARKMLEAAASHAPAWEVIDQESPRGVVDALVKRARIEAKGIGSTAARELIEELCQALELKVPCPETLRMVHAWLGEVAMATYLGEGTYAHAISDMMNEIELGAIGGVKVELR